FHTHGCLSKADGYFQVDILPFSFKTFMLAGSNEDIEISRRAAIGPGMARPRHPQAGAGIYSPGNVDLLSRGGLHPSLPPATGAVLQYLCAGAVAFRAHPGLDNAA